MAVKSEFVQALLDDLKPFGVFSARSMFGGHGLYHRNVMFGLEADGQLYVKADEVTIPLHQKENCGPFVYDGKGKPIQMSYWSVPGAAIDDPDVLIRWVRGAIEAQARAKSGQKKSRKTPVRPKAKAAATAPARGAAKNGATAGSGATARTRTAPGKIKKSSSARGPSRSR
ncbi:MAG: hypothetical protein GMKNLPBB_00538 [Myxococcota bacterium]|nr:hypothetical protein [Myxococcota bacterium]